MNPPIKAHIYTDVLDQLFLKQSPGGKSCVDGVSFTFGLTVPKGTDVLIVYNRSSYTLETDLPKERTVFVSGEPDVIHPFSCRFLNQFGIVVTTSPKELQTQKWLRATCWYWYAGISFPDAAKLQIAMDHDQFTNLEPPSKSDKISIVTSRKRLTEYHDKRLQFVESLIEKIPDHLEVYGRGFRPVEDKADAILPYQYHLAIENGGGPHTWTEKLVDPWLCWAFPFYAGCDNVEEYFPRQSFEYINLDDPDTAADQMIRDIANGRWQHSISAIAEARKLTLEKHNLMVLFGELAKAAFAFPAAAQEKPNFIWSERSLLPEKGCRGSIPEWALRNAILFVDPRAEQKTVGLRRWIDQRRSKRRAAKLEKQEQTTDN